MLIGAEVAMALMGLYALIMGKLPLKKDSPYNIRDWPARILGVIWLLPIPLAFAVGTAVAASFVAQGKPVTRESFFWVGTGIEGAVVATCLIAGAIVFRLCRTPTGP